MNTMRRILAGLALALLIASPVAAAKPAPATLTVAPSPASIGQTVWASGCGYADAAVLLRIIAPDGSVLDYGVGVWADGGCLNATPAVVSQTGDYTFQAWQPIDYAAGGIGPKTKLKASASLVVGP